MSAKLTERQQEVLGFIRSEMKAGRKPTYDTVAEHFGFSQAAARDYVRKLSDKDCLSLHLFRKRGLKKTLKEALVGRNIVIDRLGYNPNFTDAKRHLFEVPIYDPILEKEPYFDDENVSGILAVPFEPIKFFKDECIAFRYHSESMRGAGFIQGDVVIAKKTKLAASNDLVLANVSGQNVLRRIFFHGPQVTLLSNTMGVDPQSYGTEDIKILCVYHGIYRWKQ